MAVEAERRVAVIGCCFARLLVWKFGTVGAGFDTRETSSACSVWFWVEGYAFEGLGAMVAGEAMGVETLRGGADYAAFDWKSACSTLGCCATRGW
jgi:hypothetical protein